MNLARIAARATSRLPRRLLRRLAGESLVIDGNTLDLQVQALAAVSAKRSGKISPTPAAMREGFAELVSAMSGDPASGVAMHDRSIPGPGGPSPVRIYHPAEALGAAPAIVWFHQGGGDLGRLSIGSRARLSRGGRRRDRRLPVGGRQRIGSRH